mmetsp:Transcript_19168/g.72403  ORF Transcript_19168/g.72403 Transcript_19168/m.72403 type:complete len:225 (+) Transcript_19168:1075-1749(+)
MDPRSAMYCCLSLSRAVVRCSSALMYCATPAKMLNLFPFTLTPLRSSRPWSCSICWLIRKLRRCSRRFRSCRRRSAVPSLGPPSSSYADPAAGETPTCAEKLGAMPGFAAPTSPTCRAGPAPPWLPAGTPATPAIAELKSDGGDGVVIRPGYRDPKGTGRLGSSRRLCCAGLGAAGCAPSTGAIDPIIGSPGRGIMPPMVRFGMPGAGSSGPRVPMKPGGAGWP